MRLADGIVKSRDKRCSEADQRLGRKRLVKLTKLIGPLFLRRTMTDKLICASMPPKLEILVCCNPSPLQRDLYLALLPPINAPSAGESAVAGYHHSSAGQLK
jgi:SNF2 family DNA or RNA helicase